MQTVDLFGNITPEKTKEQKYGEYINSSEWKKKSKALIESVGKCQKCGVHKYVRKLSVHHLNYDNFGHERPEDLVVLCDKCHKVADRKRERETEERNYEKLEEARFQGFVDKAFGDDAPYMDNEYMYMKYQAWLEKKGDW